MPFIHHDGRALLYLHVPKTGGSTIEDWLRTIAPLRFHSVGTPQPMKCTPQHLRMNDFRELFGADYFDHVVMTVRNPYDRIASEYRMRAMLAGETFWKAAPSFSLWLEQTLEAAAKNPFHLGNHLRPQWQFLGDGVEVLKYETGLPAITARMAQILGVAAPDTLPRVFDTSAAHVTVEWDIADRLLVQEFYRKDFKVFDYPV